MSRPTGDTEGVQPLNTPHADEEPPADSRRAAHYLRGMYVALRQEGFTEAQACIILGTWLGTMGKGTA